jgi:hypothetical protein
MIDTIENKLYLQPILHEKTINILPQNIYITSDGEIKEGDWYIHKQINYLRVSNSTAIPMDAKKIILTDNKDLIKDGVQAISDEFLQWFVKNPSCERVEIINRYSDFTRTKFLDYKIIIPQEETKQEAQGYICPQTKKQCDDECCVSAEDCHIEQSIGVISDCEPDEEPCDNCDYCNNDICCCIIRTQETLEEADELVDLCNKINFVNPRERVAYYNGLKNGTKWQQDQDKNKYSEEEVLVLLLNCRGENPIDIEYWFEQFKKK